MKRLTGSTAGLIVALACASPAHADERDCAAEHEECLNQCDRMFDGIIEFFCEVGCNLEAVRCYQEQDGTTS